MADAKTPDTLSDCKYSEPLSSAWLCERRSDNANANGQEQLAALWAIAAAIYTAIEKLDDIDDRLIGIEGGLPTP